MYPLQKVRSGVEPGNSVTIENMPLLMVQVDPVEAEKEITIDQPDSMSLPQVINDVPRFPRPLTPNVDYAFITLFVPDTILPKPVPGRYHKPPTVLFSIYKLFNSLPTILPYLWCEKYEYHLKHTNLVFNSS